MSADCEMQIAEWRTVKLGDVARIDRVGMDPSALDGKTVYLGLEHLDGGGNIDARETIRSSQPKSTKFRYSNKHILFGKLRPYLRKTARPDHSGICSTDILPLLPTKEIDRDFLYHWLRTDDVVTRATKECAGANLPRLSPIALRNFELRIPHLPAQKRIAAILDAADALRAKRQQALAHLDDLLQSTFLTLFGDPVTNPMGWETSSVGTHVKVLGGYAYKSADFSNEGIPVIRISNLDGDSIDLRKCARIPKSLVGKGARFAIQPGDILIAMSGATTGKLGLVPENLTEEWLLNQRVGAYRVPANSKIHKEYLHALLRSSFYQDHVWNLAAGAAQPNISGKQLESAQIPLPPLPLQQRFAAIVEKIEAQKTRHRAHLAELDTLFASLQSRAFSGEL